MRFDFNYIVVLLLLVFLVGFIASKSENFGLQPVSITIGASASRTSCTAPCGVFFDATGTTKSSGNAFFDLDYEWNFGDPNAKFLNVPSKDATKQRGAITGHVFDKPGTHTTTLTVRDPVGSDVKSKTFTITVANPDVTYSGKTYCVSKNSDFNGCPVGAFHLISASEGLTQLFSSNGPKRVLFHSGEEYLVSDVKAANINGPFYLGAYGSGAKPVFKNTATSESAKTIWLRHDVQDLTIEGINFKAGYNPITGRGNQPQAIMWGESDPDQGNVHHFLIYRNEFAGHGLNLYSRWASEQDISNNFIFDNKITDWGDYGSLSSFYKTAVMGNSIKQNLNAVSGTEGKCIDNPCEIDFPDHGPLRVSVAEKVIIAKNDLFNNAGWFPPSGLHQPNIRLGTSGIARQSIVADNNLEGGYEIIETGRYNDVVRYEPASIIIERNIFKARENTDRMIRLIYGGTMIRNNIFLKVNKEGADKAPLNRVFDYVDGSGTFSGADHRNDLTSIYGNTFVSLETGDAEDIKFLHTKAGAARKFDVKNNIIYTPHSDKAVLIQNDNGASITAVSNIFFKPGSLARDDPLLVNPNNGDFSLRSGSLAINSGAKLPYNHDFFGNVRDSNPDIGAIEFGGISNPTPPPCTPNCSGKQCGSNGCGGSCGQCASGQQCNVNGQCVGAQPPTPTPPPSGLNLAFGTNTPVSSTNQLNIPVSLVSSGSEHYSLVDFNDDASLWMRFESRLSDELKSTRLATISGIGPIFGTGKFGQGLNLIPAGNKVTIPDDGTLLSLNKFTISVWFKVNAFDTSGTGGIMDILSNGEAHIDLNSNTRLLNTYTPAFGSMKGVTPLSLNTWYNAVVTFDGRNRKLYLNGVLESQSSPIGSIAVDNRNWILGNSMLGLNRDFNGLIDELIVFKRSLSDSEIKSLYNSKTNQYSNVFNGLVNGQSYSVDGFAVDVGGMKKVVNRNILVSTSSTPTPPPCTPHCSGKQCGSNGCGGTCGTCPSGQQCNVNGQCGGTGGGS